MSLGQNHSSELRYLINVSNLSDLCQCVEMYIILAWKIFWTRGGSKNKIVKDYMFSLLKITAQITQADFKKTLALKSVMGPRYIQKTSKSGGLLWVVDFGSFFLSNFSAPLQLWGLTIFLFSLCDLCGHFEYRKPIIVDNFVLTPPWPREFSG